jgi:tRNA nucleotidyltransferase (CCA-adding enzyme)
MTKNFKKIKINIPDDVQIIMKAFENYGYEIYVVGGCVRDSLINRPINDWDLCTKATPEEMITICNTSEFRYIPTGLRHGTITIVLNNENYEVTTYRLDGDYSDGRHPDKVSFTASLKEDLARRDFTINALAYNDKDKLVDYFGGLEDINNRIIRCVGNSEARFKEDSLRRLRAIRFAAQLGFKIDEETYSKLKLNPESLLVLSIERIKDELGKILLSNNASYGMRELANLKMLKYIIPELEECIGFDQNNKYHDKDVFEHILSVVDNVIPKLELRLSALFHDIAKPNSLTIDENGQGHFLGHDFESAKIAKEILKRLKYDNKTIEKVYILVKYHMNRYDKIKASSIKKFINRIGIDNLEDLFELQIADIKGCAIEYQNYDNVLDLREKCKRILSEKQPLAIKDLDINGKDLIELGYKPDKEMGEGLKYLLELVLEKPELNTKEQLVELLKFVNK